MKPQPKEYWQPLEAEKGQEGISSWSIRWKLCLYFDFNPVRLTSDFWPIEQ